MKTIQLLAIAATTAIIVFGFTNAPAQSTNDPAASPGSARAPLLQRIAQRLNLTDDQTSQLKSVWAGEKATVKSLLAQWQDARKDLRAAIHADDASETAVRAASAKVARVEADLAVERMKLYGKIAPILNDEQRRKIAHFEERLDGAVNGFIARISGGSDN